MRLSLLQMGSSGNQHFCPIWLQILRFPHPFGFDNLLEWHTEFIKTLCYNFSYIIEDAIWEYQMWEMHREKARSWGGGGRLRDDLKLLCLSSWMLSYSSSMHINVFTNQKPLLSLNTKVVFVLGFCVYVLGIKPRASVLLSSCSTTKLDPWIPKVFFFSCVCL